MCVRWSEILRSAIAKPCWRKVAVEGRDWRGKAQRMLLWFERRQNSVQVRHAVAWSHRRRVSLTM